MGGIAAHVREFQATAQLRCTELHTSHAELHTT